MCRNGGYLGSLRGPRSAPRVQASVTPKHHRVQVFDPPRAISWEPGQDTGDGSLRFGGWVWRYDLASAGPSGSWGTRTTVGSARRLCLASGVRSGQQGQLADGGPRFQFRERLRAVGEFIRGGLAGGEHPGGHEREQLAHDLAEDLRCGLDQHADVQAGDVDLVLVDQDRKSVV